MTNYNTSTSSRLYLLNRGNFDTWKIQVEAILVKNDTWVYVCGKRPKPIVSNEEEAHSLQVVYEKCVVEDHKAKSDLILNISPSKYRKNYMKFMPQRASDHGRRY